MAKTATLKPTQDRAAAHQPSPRQVSEANLAGHRASVFPLEGTITTDEQVEVLAAKLETLVAAGPVIVDTSKAEFLGLPAYGMLLNARNTLRDSGQLLKVVVTNPNILMFVDLSKYDQEFEVYRSLDDAHAGRNRLLLQRPGKN